MAPRDFNTDGAAGGWQTGDATADSAMTGTSVPGVTMHDPGPTAAGNGGGDPMGSPFGPFSAPAAGSAKPGALPSSGLSGGFGPFSSPASMAAPTPGMAPPSPGMSDPYTSMQNPNGDGSPGSLGSFGTVSAGGNNWMANNLGMMFADGGAVPDRMPTVPGTQSESGIPPVQPMPGPLPPTSNPFGKRGISANWSQDISTAMNTVDQALAYGRKLHGLPSEAPDAQTKQLAQNTRMPSVPGSQSESGIPPVQPMPGPLPPTSNPFGKRADSGDDETPGAPPSTDVAENETPGQTPDENDQETA